MSKWEINTGFAEISGRRSVNFPQQDSSKTPKKLVLFSIKMILVLNLALFTINMIYAKLRAIYRDSKFYFSFLTHAVVISWRFSQNIKFENTVSIQISETKGGPLISAQQAAH